MRRDPDDKNLGFSPCEALFAGAKALKLLPIVRHD